MAAASGAWSSKTPIRIPPSRHPQILQQNLQNTKNYFLSRNTLPKAKRALRIAVLFALLD